VEDNATDLRRGSRPAADEEREYQYRGGFHPFGNILSTASVGRASMDFSVTTLLKKLPDESAARGLYQRFVERVVVLSRRKLGGASRRAADEEDVAQSVFQAFFRGTQEGRFVDLNDRHDLWQVLFMLTERKATDAKRKFFSLKRGGGRVLGESAVISPCDSQERNNGLAEFADREPTPEFAAAAEEELRRLMNSLPDKELQQICSWKLEGYTNEQIAEKIGRVTRTVENKLRLIRKYWLAGPDALNHRD
jgi:DNA-directed RNA polymerase specialized sigma24 family protein